MKSQDKPVFWSEVHEQGKLALELLATLTAACRVIHENVRNQPEKMNQLAVHARNVLEMSKTASQLYGGCSTQFPSGETRVSANDLPSFYLLWSKLNDLITQLSNTSNSLHTEFSV